MKPLPVEERDLLSIEEACEYYDLYMGRFRKFLKGPGGKSMTVLFGKNTMLVIREKLENYLRNDEYEIRRNA